MKSVYLFLITVFVTACGGDGSTEDVGFDSYCDGYSYVTEDGTVEQSTECGWEDPIMSIKVDGVGTIFKPAVVSVNVTQWGDAADWTYEADGKVERDGDKLYVYNTEDAEGLTTIEVLGETVEVPLAPLPRCELNGSYDCEGNEQETSTGPLVYYGPDDTQLVEIELTFLRPRTETPELVVKEETDAEQSWVDKLNELMVESGAYVRFKLNGVYWYNYTDIFGVQYIAKTIPTDLVHMYGTSREGTCGIAFAGYQFYSNRALPSMSVCGIDTIAHELGHSMGLAHGPENQINEREGYVFPQFGHGWLDICGSQDGIMSYGTQKRYFTNSLADCMYGGARGSRQYTDSVYALNRVRYDVAMIHNEHSTNPPTADLVSDEKIPAEVVVD